MGGGGRERGDLPVGSKTCFARPPGHDRDAHGHVKICCCLFVGVRVLCCVVVGVLSVGRSHEE